jgi:hypothetical protein
MGKNPPTPRRVESISQTQASVGVGREGPFPYDPIQAPYSERENTNSSWSSNVHYGNSENEERECH